MQRDLEFTYAVYKTGSFSQAAKFLYASQPAVSMAVQRTEEELGYQIFDRQTKPLQLTAQGELFIQHIERVRDSEKMLLSELEKTNGTEHARLRIGCTPMHAIYVMPEALSRFREIEPICLPFLRVHRSTSGSVILPLLRRMWWRGNTSPGSACRCRFLFFPGHRLSNFQRERNSMSRPGKSTVNLNSSPGQNSRYPLRQWHLRWRSGVMALSAILYPARVLSVTQSPHAVRSCPGRQYSSTSSSCRRIEHSPNIHRNRVLYPLSSTASPISPSATQPTAVFC